MQTSPSPDAPQAATLRQAVLLVQDAVGAMTPIAGKPVLAWKMRELQRFGVNDFIVLGMPEDEAQSDLDHASFGLPKPPQLRFGPAGTWARVLPHLEPRFLLTAAEMLADANLALLLRDFAADAPDAPGRALVHEPDGAPAGTWAIGRKNLAGETAVAPPRQALPQTASRGFQADLRRRQGRHDVEHDLAAILQRPALFLDRDGVLNRDHGYVGGRDAWEWTRGALEAVKLATDHGWHVFVVTNQSGVARGLYTEEDVRALLLWMEDEVRRAGGTIDDTRYCPFHPEATLPAYRQESDWRKPGPGMILNLMADWDLNPQHCVLVGDQDTDLRAAEAAGIRGVLFDGADLRQTVAGIVSPDEQGAM